MLATSPKYLKKYKILYRLDHAYICFQVTSTHKYSYRWFRYIEDKLYWMRTLQTLSKMISHTKMSITKMLDYCVAMPLLNESKLLNETSYHPCGGYSVQSSNINGNNIRFYIVVHSSFGINFTFSRFNLDWSKSYCMETYVSYFRLINETYFQKSPRFCGMLKSNSIQIPSNEVGFIFNFHN